MCFAGRQKKRWEDNVREWTSLEFGKSLRAMEGREKWRKLVVKSSVVPQQPLRLRDHDDDDNALQEYDHDIKMENLLHKFYLRQKFGLVVVSTG